MAGITHGRHDGHANVCRDERNFRFDRDTERRKFYVPYRGRDMDARLGIVLERAQRWGVVLLIDEADVYIHERGANMTQNAVVGIFLRLLEYYSGILFLTTNRETLVDDAIVSRVTAHVKYDLPEADERRALWKILAAQYKLDMTRELRDALVNEFPSISGRTIMKLVRLVKVMATKLNAEPTVDMFKEAALFQKMEQRRRT